MNSFICQGTASRLGCKIFAVNILLLLMRLLSAIVKANALRSTSSSLPHANALSTFGTSMHLVSAVFVPIIDFDTVECQTRIDIELRTTLQVSCIDDRSGFSVNRNCSALDAFTFKLVNMTLSVLPSMPPVSQGHGRQRFKFGAKDTVHTALSGSVALNDRGSAHQVRVFAAQSAHSHTLQWCDNAVLRIFIRAELISSNAVGEQTILCDVQTRDFVVVHVPEKDCVDLGEQPCFDAGSNAGCFWCQRARRCVHSSKSVDDAVAQCSALPPPAPHPPLYDRYSSIQCTGGLQTWPLVAPLSNRNRICMMRSVCIADGHVTLFLPPTSNLSTFDGSQSAIHNARGIAHYDGWSTLKNDIHHHHDVLYPDGDSSGFVPRVRSAAHLVSSYVFVLFFPHLSDARAGYLFANSVAFCRCR
jgi:hypothetical protein